MKRSIPVLFLASLVLLSGVTSCESTFSSDSSSLSDYQAYLKSHHYYAGSEEEYKQDLKEGKLNTKVTVTFDSDGGTLIDSIETEYRCYINKPIVDPNKEDYYFISWKLNGIDFDFSTAIIKDTTLKAYYVDGKLTLGSYPQTHVTDTDLINTLNTLTDTNSKGFYEYNGSEYIKESGNPLESRYTFFDGTPIISGTDYWFKVEPIKWTVLNVNNTNTTIITDKILEPMKYYHNCFYLRTIDDTNIFYNNYKYSTIRAWMNGYDGSSYEVNDYTNKGFIDLAFDEEEEKKILTTTIDNSEASTQYTPNPYVCDDTLDKVFALSSKEVSSYWPNNSDRVAIPTDYALAKGAFYFRGTSYLNHGYYWLRSPSKGCDTVRSVIPEGIIFGHDVQDFYIGVRPAINIKVE